MPVSNLYFNELQNEVQIYGNENIEDKKIDKKQEKESQDEK